MLIARILLPLNLLTRREPSSFLRVGKFIDLPGRQSMVLLDRVGKFIDLPGRTSCSYSGPLVRRAPDRKREGPGICSQSGQGLAYTTIVDRTAMHTRRETYFR